jgi:hypothetical protein
MNQKSANPEAPMNDAPRCGAKNHAGLPCQSPPVKDRKRCRIHGGASTGAPRGHRNGNFKDGHWTKKAIDERRFIRSLLKRGREL